MPLEQHVFCAPVVVGGTNNQIYFNDGSATNGAIVSGTYYLYGDGSESTDLCKAIKDALESGSAKTYTVTFVAKTTAGGVTGQVVITQDSGSFHLDAEGGNAFSLATIGISSSGQDDGGASVTSTLSPTHTWCSDNPPKMFYNKKLSRPANQVVSPSGKVFSSWRGSEREMRVFDISLNCLDRTWKEAISADEARTFEAWRETVAMDAFRVYRQDTNASTGDVDPITSTELVGTYIMSRGQLERYEPVNSQPGTNLFDFSFRALKYVS